MEFFRSLHPPIESRCYVPSNVAENTQKTLNTHFQYITYAKSDSHAGRKCEDLSGKPKGIHIW